MQTEQNTSQPLKIEVGKSYRRKDGKIVSVTLCESGIKDYNLPYYCDDNLYRNSKGEAFPDAILDDIDYLQYNLVEELKV